MDPIQEAIKEIESRDLGEQFSYQQIAKKYGVPRTTLMRRHKHQNDDYSVRNQSLHLERKAKLIQYIETLTKRRLPPTRTIIQQFTS
jgi:phage portal protein BeeE